MDWLQKTYYMISQTCMIEYWKMDKKTDYLNLTMKAMD